MNNLEKPKIIIFSSGTKDGGGSGFENLVNARFEKKEDGSPRFNADIVAVVSNHLEGGVREKADRLGIPFIHFNGPYTAENYQKIVDESGAEWATLSGWIKMTAGLNPKKTTNIHPALLSESNRRFGGKGMYGMNVHRAVKEAYDKGEITHSGATMHYVNDKYDDGEIIFEHKIKLEDDMTAEDIAMVVNRAEHKYQPDVLNKILNSLI